MRRRLMDSVNKAVDGVNLVKGLISHGTEYIDTGIALDDETVIDSSFYIESFHKNYENYFGGYWNDCGIIRDRWNKSLSLLFRGTKEGTNYISISTPMKADININVKDEIWSVNAETMLINKSVPNAFTENKTVWIFAKEAEQGGATDVPGSFELYSFSISSSDGINKIDLYPALDPNGIPCLYDTVSKSYFYNEGTGTFGYETLEGEIVNG